MKLHNMLPFRAQAIGLALLSLSVAALADDLSQTYCSTQNTGSDFSAVNNIYQSNGACYTTCNSQSYAFAIVQWQNCWCSNYIPATQDDTSNCSEKCPGYPDELCGNQDTGYYGYVALPNSPSGTAGASSASSTSQPSSTEESSSTQEPATSYVSTTIENTVTLSQSQSVIVSYVTPTPSTHSTTSSKLSTTSTSSTSAPSTTETPATPVTSVIMTTISGAIVTQTVTTTPMVAPGSHSDQIPLEQQSSGLGSGAIAGIVIGALAGVALLAAAAFFLWRRKRAGNDDAENSASGGSKKSMTRNVSVLSKAGLLARTRASMGDRDHDDAFYVTPATGQNSVRHSMLFTGADGISPVSPLDSSHSNDSGKSGRGMVYDQRLNPSALFANHENGSRISMQDTQDYSRPLGVTNPDPRASFDSRLSRGG